MPGKEWRPARRLQSIIGDGYGKIDSDSWNSSVLPLAVAVREMGGPLTREVGSVQIMNNGENKIQTKY